MRRGIITVGVLLVLAAGTASASTFGGPVSPVDTTTTTAGAGNPATATLSTTASGAQAALTLKLHAELQCGRPQGRTFVVHLPAAMHVPASIAKAGVALAGRTPARVAVAAHAVTVTAPLPKGAICDVLAPGWFSIAFTHAAGLRNPASAGSYRFDVSGKPGGTWRGSLTIR